MKWRRTNLPWLPRPPADFRARCKAVDAEGGARGPALARLAAFALEDQHLVHLARSIATAGATGVDLAPLGSFRLGILSNATTELIIPALVGSAARFGISLDVVEAPFDQSVQVALNSDSPFQQARPDAVLLAFDHRILPEPAASNDAQLARNAMDAALNHIVTVRDGLAAGCGAPVIVQTLAPPPEAVLGSFDTRLPGSRRRLVHAFNGALVESLRETPSMLLDVAALAETVGLDAWHDAGQWYLAKIPFAQELVPLYADHVGRLLGAIRGRSRKCLVLDLDNTLWGGVIGDDGVDGIVLGQGDPGGEAFVAVQRMALELRDHGIVLAVCSKNEDAIAREPFRNHPDMVLTEDDIACFQANWSDKASNIEAIAAALNIGVDSLVLIDDNPAERALVRNSLPEVAVPELPDDPALFRRTILAAGYFEAVNFSEEDRTRAADYKASSRRGTLQAGSRDLTAYLESLEMEIDFAPFDAQGRGRIAQLINKSNQFNLTTRRYTEAELGDMEKDTTVFTLQARLGDAFGYTGMIGVVICRTEGERWDIDTWIMSCRVLGRRVEEAALGELARQARQAGATTLTGRYVPTERNALVRDHFAKLGFERTGEAGEDEDATSWRLDVETYEPPALPITVKRRFIEQVA